ncbi:HIT family protein [Noviherbaspirillum cavernae]|uniref:HIT family protein n=1 Tax=Noviherbaspirillum cavernae TaxID=2320862 RepID=A0A418WXP2_9BURK|nr:HIT family protein [Noviherbaspirillum cavernae]RJG04996.1 HIT family protein [Noviherbaspirillum cavernae]
MAKTSCELCAQLGGEVVYRNDQYRVVLVDDAHYPGFCRVIWNGHAQEMTDLPAADRTVLMDAVWQVEDAVREIMHPDKINVASLGNMVPHVHWHVIPRFTSDAHFPNPIWGEVRRTPDSADLSRRRALLPRLRAAIVERLDQSAQSVF